LSPEHQLSLYLRSVADELVKLMSYTRVTSLGA